MLRNAQLRCHDYFSVTVTPTAVVMPKLVLAHELSPGSDIFALLSFCSASTATKADDTVLPTVHRLGSLSLTHTWCLAQQMISEAEMMACVGYQDKSALFAAVSVEFSKAGRTDEFQSR
ncbi:hypothetical protein CRM22_009379 [Opisthorchis felineus]|uniref:Uncharacterized protein n=1 Tax=Opisthorchis felineus TaxID=147828 RepID=A0A4S2L7T1_OPIFE|nr:hypothetical protein CRM22_009379 [Opisthorchis felineus]